MSVRKRSVSRWRRITARAIPGAPPMSARWLADATLFGPAAMVRDGVALWRESGITTPILVPSSATGNQLKAVEEIFAAFA